MLQRNQKTRHKNIITIVGLITTTALIASPWREIIFQPLFSIARAAASSTYEFSVATKAKLARPSAEELAHLAQQGELLAAENARLRSVIAENEALKAALDYRDNSDDTAITAKVLAGTFTDADRTLIIDKGSVDGTTKGQVVLSPTGIAIGKIFSTSDHTSIVALLADGRSRLAVTIMAPTPIDGILEGERGTAAVIPLIPERTEIPPGTPLVTAGLEPGIRRGIPVGTIERTEDGKNEPFQRAYLDLRSNAPQPAFVNIVVDPQTSPASEETIKIES